MMIHSSLWAILVPLLIGELSTWYPGSLAMLNLGSVRALALDEWPSYLINILAMLILSFVWAFLASLWMSDLPTLYP
jgi:hypothetical protein